MWFKSKKVDKSNQEPNKRKMLTISRIDQDLLPLLKTGARARGLHEWAYYNEILWMVMSFEMVDMPELLKILPPNLDLEANPCFASAQNRVSNYVKLMKSAKQAKDFEV